MVIEAVDRDPGSTVRTRRTQVRMIATVAVLVALVVSAFALQNVLTSRHNRAPYDAVAIGASVRMEVVAPARAQAAVDQLAGPGRLVAPIGGEASQQQVVGQLTFRTPPNAPQGGQYALFLIDRALGQPVSMLFATGPDGTNVGQGWDGRYNKVAAKYPWLHMLAAIQTPDGWSDPGMAVSFAPNTPGPVTFAAVLDPASLPITDPAQQLTVALVFIGANDHIYWATKLAG
ncbi:MAG TPA: hypothetical protein VH298_13180 [Jatrophihabitans sp.]|jgi:hypothetical protein|nr:hypothetical protein [Jatrophihabitans sp.]